MSEAYTKLVQPTWGGWELWQSKEEPTLLQYNRAANYWIPIDDLKTSAQVLDWIAQVKQKSWAGDSCLAGLVRALDDCLNLQANFCGSGIENTDG